MKLDATMHAAVALILSALVSGCANSGQQGSDPPAVVPTSATGTDPPVTVAPANTSEAKPPARLQFSDLSLFAGFFPVPVAAVRSSVPPEYAIPGEKLPGAMATLVVGVNKATIAIDEMPGRNATLVEILVVIQPHDSTPGLHVYHLWWASEDQVLLAALKAAGFPTETANATLNVTPEASGFGGSAESVGSNTTFTMEGTGRPAFLPIVPLEDVLPVTYWRKSGEKTVAIDFLAGGDGAGTGNVGGGEAVITVPAGSRLAQLLGGTSVTGTAFAPDAAGGPAVFRYM